MTVAAAGVEIIGGEAQPAVRLAADAIAGLGLYTAVVLRSSRGIRSDLRVAVAREAST